MGEGQKKCGLKRGGARKNLQTTWPKWKWDKRVTFRQREQNRSEEKRTAQGG